MMTEFKITWTETKSHLWPEGRNAERSLVGLVSAKRFLTQLQSSSIVVGVSISHPEGQQHWIRERATGDWIEV